MKLFYDHLIEKNHLIALIGKHAKSKKDRKKLLGELDELLHKAVLDVALIHLEERHHEEFLAMVHATPHSESILLYLKQKAHPEIEGKIRGEIEKLFQKIIKDLDN